jgi:hypothetical protein
VSALHAVVHCLQVLEDYVLYYNYWRMNLKDGDLAFANQGKGNKGGDYFG